MNLGGKYSTLAPTACGSFAPVGPLLSAVVPCYNEAAGVGELHRRLGAACQKALERRPGEYEIILVNDGSRDKTWEAIRKAADGDPHIMAVNLSRNHGHQLALTAGLSVCRGKRILIIDADLQDPPELLETMMQMMDKGIDVIYGQRRRRAGETLFKRATAAAFYRIVAKLTETRIPHDTGDFRLMSRRALDVLLTMRERYRFIRGMVSWIGFRQEPLLYDRDARFAGETSYPFHKMYAFAVDAITSFSIKPLIFAGVVGVSTGVMALLILVYAFVGWGFGRAISGWTSTIGVITLLGSAQLVVLGIIGEYVGRLYEQSKGRPLFIIEEVYRGSECAEMPPLETEDARRQESGV